MKPIYKALITVPFIVYGVSLLAGCQNQTANVTLSEAEARIWCAKMLPDWQIVAVNSASMDTNGDGYVSCDVALKKDGVTRIIQLDCPEQGDPLQIQKGQNAKYKNSPMQNNW